MITGKVIIKSYLLVFIYMRVNVCVMLSIVEVGR